MQMPKNMNDMSSRVFNLSKRPYLHQTKHSITTNKVASPQFQTY